LVMLAANVRPAWSFDLLAGLGSNNFTVSSSSAPYSQSSTNLTLDAPFFIGQSVLGQFGSAYDWSAVTSFGLIMSAPGASPNAPFTLEFFDPSTNTISAFQGFASNLGSEPEFVALSPSALGTEDFTVVSGLAFTWDDGGASSVQIAGVVPEPSTWALLVCGAVLLGFVLIRSRKNA